MSAGTNPSRRENLEGPSGRWVGVVEVKWIDSRRSTEWRGWWSRLQPRGPKETREWCGPYPSAADAVAAWEHPDES